MRTFTKRTVAVLSPLAILGIAGVAYAATLTTTSTQLGAGGTDVSSCAATAKVSYTEKFVSGASAHYGLDTVVVTFKDGAGAAATACNGDNWRLAITGGSGTTLKEYTSVSAPVTAISAGVLTFTVPTLDDVHATDVTGVYVVTEG